MKQQNEILPTTQDLMNDLNNEFKESMGSACEKLREILQSPINAIIDTLIMFSGPFNKAAKK